MPDIRPFRNVNEDSIVNVFTFASGTLAKGTIVKVWGSGFNPQANPVDFAGALGQSYNDTVSTRWAVPHQFTASNSGDAVRPLGITLNDIREVDENGELLVFNPIKRQELQAVLTGQACPVATKGQFLYSGITGDVVAGKPAYVTNGGGIGPSGTSNEVIGTFLGAKDSRGWCLVKLDL
jgi:hypothetical protein